MSPKAKTIMVQGTASDVGKSVVTTALCRMLKRQGYRVAPFKAQNMSNNSFVTQEGGEIGRAQAVQAFACGVEPSVAMNPVLLKPNTDKTSQVVVMGKVFATTSATHYYQQKETLRRYVYDALQKLIDENDYVILEGAGSPVEMNIKDNDIVNMSVAKEFNIPVVLVGDIDKGGIFAQIIGTFNLLDKTEQELTKTFLINKFRGELSILQPGLQYIEEQVQRKALGVLPMIPNLDIEQEDGVVLEQQKNPYNYAQRNRSTKEDQLLVQVIHLPRISNFTDFDPLINEPDVNLEFINRPQRNVIPDLLIIPGTKSTMGDLQFLRESGLAGYIERCYHAGTSILGICGGYQMLGKTIEDPYQSESNISACEGLGLLPVKTIFSREKTTVQIKGIHISSQLPITGYEIHMGQTESSYCGKLLFQITERNRQPANSHDGIIMTKSENGAVWGTYIHGLFEQDDFRRYFINTIREASGLERFFPERGSMSDGDLAAFDRLVDIFEKHTNAQVLSEVLDLPLAKTMV